MAREGLRRLVVHEDADAFRLRKVRRDGLHDRVDRHELFVAACTPSLRQRGSAEVDEGGAIGKEKGGADDGVAREDARHTGIGRPFEKLPCDDRQRAGRVLRKSHIARLANEEHLRPFEKKRHRAYDDFVLNIEVRREDPLPASAREGHEREREHDCPAYYVHYVPVLVVAFGAVVVVVAGAVVVVPGAVVVGVLGGGVGLTTPMRVS